MLDVEVLTAAEGALPRREVLELCELAATARGLNSGHVAVEFVSEQRIAELNRAHRSKGEPTDVLSFPIDELSELPAGQERELGDIVICPSHTVDLREAILHGMLHLLGMDHEHDEGEMLALQRELLERAPAAAAPAGAAPAGGGETEDVSARAGRGSREGEGEPAGGEREAGGSAGR